MGKEKIGFIRAFFRYFRYRDWKKARGVSLSEEEQFTASVDGIAAAFDIQYKKMADHVNGLKEAIDEVESVLEAKRSRLKKLDEEKEDLLREREKTTIQSRLDEIEQTRPRLHQEIIEITKNLEKYMLKLQEFQAQIDMLPKQKEQAIADFIAAKQAIENNDQA